MTEAEWLAATDSGELIEFLNNRDASARKFRLFSCACCRRIWHLLDSPEARQAVDVAERFADGLATEAEMERAESMLRDNFERPASWAATRNARAEEAALKATWLCGGKEGNAEGAGYLVLCIPDAVVHERLGAWTQDAGSIAHEVEHQLCDMLRDVFGNPFRPVAFDPEWRTSTAVALVRQMYEARDFSLMPILADALQDAGCDNDDILTHCRGPGPHVRGCWVVDLVLGKQ